MGSAGKSAGHPYHAMLWWSTLFSVFTGIACLVYGHAGEHDIDWVQSGISTFAAKAPRDDWVTASMILFALASAQLGLMLSLTGRLCHRLSAHLASMLLGCTSVGLLLVACYEESYPYPPQNFDAVRQQAFHDAGVMIFFFCALLALLIIGGTNLLCPKARDNGFAFVERLTGLGLLVFFALTQEIMRRNWPTRIGFKGPAMGLRQRSSFSCLGIGLLLTACLLRPTMKGQCCCNLNSNEKIKVG